jgi:GTP-binding protein
MSGYPDARFLTSASRPDQFVGDEGAEVAVAGRSNAGKSSAINAVVGQRQLAHTSRTPGRTRLVNFFHLAAGERLVDLPGYGFARVPSGTREDWRRLLETYFEIRRSLRGLFLAVDVRRTLGELDLQMLAWCRALGRPVHILLTKADKLDRGLAARSLASTRAACGTDVTAQLFSARTGEGVVAARARLRDLLNARLERALRIRE